MTDERPDFRHRRERHGLIGPFSGRQLVAVQAILPPAAAGSPAPAAPPPP